MKQKLIENIKEFYDTLKIRSKLTITTTIHSLNLDNLEKSLKDFKDIEITGRNENNILNIPDNPWDMNEIMDRTYTSVYSDPKPNMLAWYGRKNRPLHVGEVQEDGRILSNWCGLDVIHPAYHVPFGYGNSIRYGEKPKEEFIHEILEKKKHYNSVKMINPHFR